MNVPANAMQSYFLGECLELDVWFLYRLSKHLGIFSSLPFLKLLFLQPSLLYFFFHFLTLPQENCLIFLYFPLQRKGCLKLPSSHYLTCYGLSQFNLSMALKFLVTKWDNLGGLFFPLALIFIEPIVKSS